ncbi:MAG: hypothetical protein BGO98_16445 [Myxococcales bacterium 68-20]|nr:MAG: hypothetical protein BGO98_16445 [Myxococcales bacterium 68-20]
MRARIGIIPVALVGVTGCGLRPWTPSVSVAFWSEDVPDRRDFALPSSSELAARWQMAPESPWARYHKGTLISSVDPMAGHAALPDVRRLEVAAEADAAAAHVARVGLPADTLWLVDLRGAASAAFASRLSRDSREPIAPVVTFNNWPAHDSVVPADETLAGLLAFPPRLPPPERAALESAHPVFLLDSWRLAYRFDTPDDETFDNRYMLMPGDLPDVETLRARHITRVVYVVEDLDDAEVEEDDLNASFRAWQAAGISIFIVDLAFLKAAPAPVAGAWPVDWAARLAPRGYWVRERYTLVDDPYFYARARGGFGLAFGRPFIYPGYHWVVGPGSGGSRGGSSG